MRLTYYSYLLSLDTKSNLENAISCSTSNSKYFMRKNIFSNREIFVSKNKVITALLTLVLIFGTVHYTHAMWFGTTNKIQASFVWGDGNCEVRVEFTTYAFGIPIWTRTRDIPCSEAAERGYEAPGEL